MIDGSRGRGTVGDDRVVTPGDTDKREGAEMKEAVTIEEPTFARWLFVSRQAAWIWLVVRVWLGYQWLHAGWEKVTGTSGGTWSWQFAFTDDSWLKSSAGLKGFAAFALQGAGAEHAAVNYGWYAHFLHYLSTGGGWMAPLIAIGEVAIGLGLILGLFTGIAAFFAGILTTSFGLAGVAGVNHCSSWPRSSWCSPGGTRATTAWIAGSCRRWEPPGTGERPWTTASRVRRRST